MLSMIISKLAKGLSEKQTSVTGKDSLLSH